MDITLSSMIFVLQNRPIRTKHIFDTVFFFRYRYIQYIYGSILIGLIVFIVVLIQYCETTVSMHKDHTILNQVTSSCEFSWNNKNRQIYVSHAHETTRIDRSMSHLPTANCVKYFSKNKLNQWTMKLHLLHHQSVDHGEPRL